MPLSQKEFTDPPPHPAIGTPANSPVAEPWYSIGPGIWELLLNGDLDQDEKSVLQWYEPHAVSVTDQVITHAYVEEVVFIEGGLEDVTLGRAWGRGAYAYRRPGMRHGPYRALDGGCLQFVRVRRPGVGEGEGEG